MHHVRAAAHFIQPLHCVVPDGSRGFALLIGENSVQMDRSADAAPLQLASLPAHSLLHGFMCRVMCAMLAFAPADAELLFNANVILLHLFAHVACLHAIVLFWK